MSRHPKIILVAEDEVLIRGSVADALTEAGFVVLEASHAAEALDILNGQADSIAVLFTDIHMPGDIDGLDLAHHALGKWPWIALLIASGKARPEPDELPTGSRFLAKPYHPHHAVKHVAEMAEAA